MIKRTLITVSILVILVLKYFISACPMLPGDFFTTQMYVDDLDFHYQELNDPMAKAFIWLDCYLSVPGTVTWLPRSTRGGVELRFDEEGDFCCMVTDSETFGTLTFFVGEEQKNYLTVPGLGTSLHYLAYGHKLAEAIQGGEVQE